MGDLMVEFDICLDIFEAHLFQDINKFRTVSFREARISDLFEFWIFQFVLGAANSGIDCSNCFKKSSFCAFVSVKILLLWKVLEQGIELNKSYF
jgi:hypothetical protein